MNPETDRGHKIIIAFVEFSIGPKHRYSNVMTTWSCNFDKSKYRQLRMCYDYKTGQQPHLLEKNPLGTSRQLLVTCMCVCVCVCLCVCVYVRPTTVKTSSVWIRWDAGEQINDVMLKTLNSYADSLHCYFRMKKLTVQLVALSCSHTRSGQSHDLNSIRLVFRTWTFIHH